VDLVTGEPAGVKVRREGRQLVVDDLVVGGAPIAIRWSVSVPGLQQYTVRSEYQSVPARVEILLPDHLDPQRKYPVVYILPVEPEHRNEYGHGLVEAQKADIANKYEVICVYPSFAAVPWFGNHADDPGIRQLDYILHSLIPGIDSKYPTQPDKEGRWLIGFSKSGWGAFKLMLQFPDIFGYAAAWDAPFMLSGDNTGDEWGPVGIKSVYGTKETFQQALPFKLASEQAGYLRQRCRLVLGGSDGWKTNVEDMHALLNQLNIPHVHRPDLNLPHRWASGWFPPLMEDLARVARAPLP
jgi:S-formylglutathione hydrolase FrmB